MVVITFITVVRLLVQLQLINDPGSYYYYCTAAITTTTNLFFSSNRARKTILVTFIIPITIPEPSTALE